MNHPILRDAIARSNVTVETQRPAYLAPLGVSDGLVSNSERTVSLTLFTDTRSGEGAPQFLEKTINLNTPGHKLNDQNEILFYLELRDRMRDLPHVVCADLVALRWEDEDRITLRMSFLPDAEIAKSHTDRAAAFRALGEISSRFVDATDLPDWLKVSGGMGPKVPPSSLEGTRKLLAEVSMEHHLPAFEACYANGPFLRSEYKKGPFTLFHGDANHQNIRIISGTDRVAFLDWPRVNLAHIGHDAARLLQPWIVFYSTAKDRQTVLRIETEMLDAFAEAFPANVTQTAQWQQRLRLGYDMSSVIVALGVAGYFLGWIKGAATALERDERCTIVKIWYIIIIQRAERLAKMDNDRIAPVRDRYLGQEVSVYNQKRQGDVRWQREHAGTAKFIERHAGKSVLDCPVGTGRFVPLYKEFDMKAIGLDRSSAMLVETQKEMTAQGFDNIALHEADATDFKSEMYEADLVVSTRFFNWLPADLARAAFLNLAAACKEEMLITLTTIDPRKFEGKGRERVENRLSKSHDPKPDSDIPPNGPHSYTGFLEWLEVAQMDVVESSTLAEGKNELIVELITLRRRGV